MDIDYVFKQEFDFTKAIEQTKEVGYFFGSDVLSESINELMKDEGFSLELEEGDCVNHPIWPGSKREVRQLHARSYKPRGDFTVPIASSVSEQLSLYVKSIEDLKLWMPSEMGYQVYRSSSDFISPHRDRKSDQMLSITFTLCGSAPVRVLKPLGHPNDYTNLAVVEEFVTRPGSIMMLRAPGLGNGEQHIHEVLPPIECPRLIINLRMRPDVLPRPSHMGEKHL